METDSESIDVASIKWALLQHHESIDQDETAPEHQPTSWELRQVHAIQNAFALHNLERYSSRDQDSVATTAQPFSIPNLGSTVPDSQDGHLPNVDQQSPFVVPPPVRTATAVQKMMSQASVQSTQELSQSHFDSIFNQSPGGAPDAPPPQDHPQPQGETGARDRSNNGNDGDEDTQFTRHEGDEGHIDLLSGLGVNDAEPDDDSQGSDPPVDFSPSQPQAPLSQYPESQRFKTPATVGKKRKYASGASGASASPLLPKRPMLRQDLDANAPTSIGMGLSQVFAATQADTSPFVGNGSLNPQSDRPSPNIDLQPRPVTAMSSSPLRPLSEFKRAATEPASQYVSVKQSQTRRRMVQEQERIMRAALDPDDDFDEDFDDEPTPVLKQRHREERERRIRATFAQISSPVKRSSSPTKRAKRAVSMSKSSPIRGVGRSSPRQDYLAPSSPPSPLRGVPGESSPGAIGDTRSGGESEGETEADANAIAVPRSSPGHLADLTADDEEDASQRHDPIPETAARLYRTTDHARRLPQESPSLRRTGRTKRPASTNSSEPFAVADSQPTQSQLQRSNVVGLEKTATDDDDVQFVPQSPSGSPVRTMERARSEPEQTLVGREVHPVDNVSSSAGELMGQLAAPPPGSSNQAFSSQMLSEEPGSVVPETSSRKEFSRPQDNSQQISTDSRSRSGFETAQSHLPASNAGGHALSMQLDDSSPPIITGHRRKRMDEIAAEPSPLKPQASFNASEALCIDYDFQISSQRSATTRVYPPRRTESAPIPEDPSAAGEVETEEQFEVASPNLGYESADDGLDPREEEQQVDDDDDDDDGTRPGSLAQSPRYSRRDRKQTNKVLEELKTRPAKPAPISRPSQWDLDLSPPPKAVPVPKRTSRPPTSTASSGIHDRRLKSLQKRPKPARSDLTSKPRGRLDSRSRLETVPETAQIQNENRDGSIDSPDPIALSGAATPEPTGEATTAPCEEIIAPNMVFACFNGKTRAFYPAICIGQSPVDASRYQIQWEGFDPDEIDSYGLCSLDLRVGDQVKLDMKGFPKVSYIIRGFKNRIEPDLASNGQNSVTDIRGYKTLVVAQKSRKSLPHDIAVSSELLHEVPITAIYLDNNMWGRMKDRSFKYHPVEPPQHTSGSATPAERATTPNTPSSRNRRTTTIPAIQSVAPVEPTGVFANMAFAVSYEQAARKSELVSLIEANGGLVLKGSFLDVLDNDLIQLKDQYSTLGFTALLADRHSRKEKYMQSLALGIPCVSGNWIHACLREQSLVDFMTYLLPAGECVELEGATRSRVLPHHVADASIRLSQVLASRPNVLHSANVVVVTGRGKIEAKRKPYLFLVRALGAGNIEILPDIATAVSHLAEEQGTKYIFVDDRDVESTRKLLSDNENSRRKRGSDTTCTILGNEAIVQSLILGRLWTG